MTQERNAEDEGNVKEKEERKKRRSKKECRNRRDDGGGDVCGFNAGVSGYQ